MSWFHRLLILGLIVALVLVYIKQLWVGIRAGLRTRNWIEQPASIVDLRQPWWLTAPITQRYPRFKSRTIDVAFEYEYQGKRYRGTQTAVAGLYVTSLTITQLYRKLENAVRGERQVTVWVNPVHPEEAVLLTRNDKLAAVGGALIVLIVSGVAALVFLR